MYDLENSGQKDQVELDSHEKREAGQQQETRWLISWEQGVSPKNPTSGDWIIQEETSAAQQIMAEQYWEARRIVQKRRS